MTPSDRTIGLRFLAAPESSGGGQLETDGGVSAHRVDEGLVVLRRVPEVEHPRVGFVAGFGRAPSLERDDQIDLERLKPALRCDGLGRDDGVVPTTEPRGPAAIGEAAQGDGEEEGKGGCNPEGDER